MALNILTWNINSVRLRKGLVARLAREADADIICLQETKCRDGEFPLADIRALGFTHVAMHGQKGYHGVAVLSRLPFAHVERQDFCAKGDARHLAVRIEGAGAPLTLHNFYVPAGGDVPDRTLNDKFAHKLDFLAEMRDWSRSAVAGPGHHLLLGDLNVAPLEQDVWSHKQLLDVVSHTPQEVEALGLVQAAGGWVDIVREAVPPPEKLFTWWSYRARDWAASNRGRRLDHIWSDAALARRVRAIRVLREARSWERPSDHVPVLAVIDEETAAA
jgi:exodeoxyribonuclease-3